MDYYASGKIRKLLLAGAMLSWIVIAAEHFSSNSPPLPYHIDTILIAINSFVFYALFVCSHLCPVIVLNDATVTYRVTPISKITSRLDVPGAFQINGGKLEVKDARGRWVNIMLSFIEATDREELLKRIATFKRS